MKKHSPPEPPSWLEQAFPQIHYLLLALDGAPLREMADLLPALEEERIGHGARVRLARGGAVQELDLIVAVRGDRRAGGDR